MTDAEIKELAIKCGGTILESYTSTSEGNTTALLLTMRELNSFAKEIEAITVPEGWRLVPIEPTVEIFYALRVGSRKDNPSDELCRLRYAALLAALLAAPKKGK